METLIGVCQKEYVPQCKDFLIEGVFFLGFCCGSSIRKSPEKKTLSVEKSLPQGGRYDCNTLSAELVGPNGRHFSAYNFFKFLLLVRYG